MKIITPEQMRELESIAIEELEMPSLLLMENAASAVFAEINRDFKKGNALIYVGPGNNGGDALAIGRKLVNAGFSVWVVMVSGVENLSQDGRLNLKLFEAAGGRFGNIGEKADFVVDGIFGTGLSRKVADEFLTAINEINSLDIPIYSVDIPSGLHGFSGKVLGTAVKAYKTITFVGCKTGLIIEDGMDYAGQVIVADLDIPMTEKIRNIFTIRHAGLNLPKRLHNSHKGNYGRVVCVAGSGGMRGAASLLAKGALDTGAGLVTVATTERVWQTVSVLVPRAMAIILEENQQQGISAESTDKLLSAIEKADVIVAGSGMMSTEDTRRIILSLLSTNKPLVLDADGLNSITKEELRPGVVITPHDMEMSRLTGLTVEAIKADRLTAAKELADETGSVVLLKGCGTVIAGEKGLSINTSGGPEMAIGGTGDILAGRIAALIGQGLSLEDAAAGGAYLNGIKGTGEENEFCK